MGESWVAVAGTQQPRGFEEVEERVAVAEDRPSDEPTAGEAENVPVAGVTARHPDPVLTRNATDGGQEIEDHPEDPGPAVVDPQRAADERRDEVLERALNWWREHFVRRELVLERDVAEPARDDAAVLGLVPVVEAVTSVVRDLEEALHNRLGRDDLAASRDDQTLERAQEPLG